MTFQDLPTSPSPVPRLPCFSPLANTVHASIVQFKKKTKTKSEPEWHSPLQTFPWAAPRKVQVPQVARADVAEKQAAAGECAACDQLARWANLRTWLSSVSLPPHSPLAEGGQFPLACGLAVWGPSWVHIAPGDFRWHGDQDQLPPTCTGAQAP